MHCSTGNISIFLGFQPELSPVAHFPATGLCHILPRIIHGVLSESTAYGEDNVVVDLCMHCSPIALIDGYF